MARIAFFWELGDGLGHLLPHVDLVSRLVQRGDDVTFVTKDVTRTRSVFSDPAIKVRPLKAGFTPQAARIRDADSFPEVLFNCGFNNADVIQGRVGDIIKTIEDVAPELLICDYAPSVLLANKVTRRPLITTGNGFCMPVPVEPMPRFRYWHGTAPERLRASEETVLGFINDVLRRFDSRLLNSFSDLLRADFEWLCTYEELDFYTVRSEARYFGLFPPMDFGEPPVWPSASRPRIFAYLAPGRTTSLALETMSALGAAVCLYAPSLREEEKNALDPARFHVAAAPLSLRLVAPQCDVFVNNGNHTTVAAGMLAGKAQLSLPRAAEQYLNARRLELAGAGLAASQRNSGDIGAKLSALLSDPAYQRSAERFAEKYAGRYESDRTDIMLSEIDQVV